GRDVYECLRDRLDFTKYDENVKSQPFYAVDGSFLILCRSTFKAHAETCEIKGHYFNATAGTSKEMIKRVVFPRELGVLIVMHDYLTAGFTTTYILSNSTVTLGNLRVDMMIHPS
ncbi:hypothetical protein EJD97_008956, partial [Solanum chilense]